MRVLACGGRNFQDRESVFLTLDNVHVTHLVTGDAEGADALAREWARARCIPLTTHFANWVVFGKAAGPVRNQRMLDEEKPLRVIAFLGGKGTAHMVRIAKAANVEVTEIPARTNT